MRIEILVFIWRLLEIPAFRLQLSGRKPEEHPFTFTLNFLNKYTGRIYSSCFLPDICNRNAGISGSLQTKTRISILPQSFGSGSAQPLAKGSLFFHDFLIPSFVICFHFALAPASASINIFPPSFDEQVHFPLLLPHSWRHFNPSARCALLNRCSPHGTIVG